MAAKKKKGNTVFEFPTEGDIAERSNTATVAEPKVSEARNDENVTADVAPAANPTKRTRKKATSAEGDTVTGEPVTPAVSEEVKPAPKRTRKKATSAEGNDVTNEPAAPTVSEEVKPASKRTRKPKATPTAEGASTPAPVAESAAATPAEGETQAPQKTTRSRKKSTPVAEKTTEVPSATQQERVQDQRELPPPILPVPRTRGNEVSTETSVPILMPEREKRAFWSRLLALLVLTAIIVTSILIFKFRPTTYSERTHSIQFYYNTAENCTVVAVNGTNRGEITGALQTVSYNKNGEVCAALIAGKLYVVKGDKAEEIAANVSDFVLSSDGNTVAYRAANTLYYATVGKDDAREITRPGAALSEYCLSPNGKELFFTYHNEDDQSTKRIDVVSQSGNRPELTETAELTPVAVTNDCAYLYYTDASGALQVLNGKTQERKLCTATPDLSTLVFNRDMTELMLVSGGKTLLFVRGENRVLPEVADGETLSLLTNQRVAARDLAFGKQYMLNTLYKNYYLQQRGTGTMLTYMNDSGHLTDISFVKDTSAVTVTDKWVFYLITEQRSNEIRTHLYRCKTGNTEGEVLEWNVKSYCSNVDGSRVLFVNEHEKLYTRRTEGKIAEQLADSVLSGSIAVTLDDAFYFYTASGELWTSDNGDAPRQVATGVIDFTVDAHTLYYLADCDANGVGTLYSNNRNQRRSKALSTGIQTLQ